MTRPIVHAFAAALLVMALAPAARAAAPERGDSSAMDWSRVPEYRIVPGDVLNLNFGPRIDQASDLVRTVKVRPDGRISVFPIGDVVAAGHTPRELEQALLAQLAPDLKNPRVTVDVAELAGNEVHVLGQVTYPKSVPAAPFMTVLQAIAQAGGFKDDAAKNSVLLYHRDGARDLSVTRLRLDHAVKSGDLTQDLPVGRFDIIYVPRNSIGNLDVFTRTLFVGPEVAVLASLQGWQLFNLDRVFVVAGR